MSDYAEAGRRPFGGRTRDNVGPVTPSVSALDGPAGLERAAYYALLAFAATLQFSIFASELLLTVTGVLWLALVIRNHERIDVPPMFWPLAAYAAATLVASILSVDPRTSLIDCKQLLLFSVVPIAYRLLTPRRALTIVDIIITVGALSAVVGVIQFGVFKFDNLAQRPQGALGMYMTYSGQLMLVACVATARLVFRKDDRMWAALVMPALIVALAATLSRNAWVGACAGIGLLFLIRDFRLVALLPVVAAIFIAIAPAQVTDRLFSMVQLRNSESASVQSNVDRLAMARMGLRIIRDHPLTGVGPDMVIQVYPQYRDAKAVNQLNSHLHNVPLQIAAERGLPALAVWLWFIGMLVVDLARRWKSASEPSLPAGALASVVALLAAGLFEYNFGDSEVLMLFLVIIMLPYAADRVRTSAQHRAA